MSLSIDDIPKSQRSGGLAAVLAIGTANPPNIFYQSSFPDFYFRITKSLHQLELKEKFKRICEKTEIEKRHMFLTEEILNANPSICSYDEPSLNARQKLLGKEVPALGMEAALKAISEWGQPKSSITHLIFCTSSSVGMPGSDSQLAKLLGLNPSVNRIMLLLNGCFAGGTTLRLAKDFAENNKGARVLAVCSELNAIFFRGLSVSDPSSLIGPALFGDGAAAVIVGADPIPNIEKPLFQLARARQTLVPETDSILTGHFLEVGLTFYVSKDLPDLLSNNIESGLIEAFEPFGITNWNSLFWVLHPGGPLVLKKIEAKLNLNEDKLGDTRKVLRDYGNMSSVSVFFVLDELRKRSIEEGSLTTGHGLDWGALIGLGPGLTIETVVLHSVPL